MKIFRTLAVSLAVALAASGAALAQTLVEIRTNLGNMTVELYPDKAPGTVENFLQYAKDGFYKGTIFHRVIPGFMIQGGGFTRDYSQKPTRDPVRNEANNGLRNTVGTIAMARTSNPHSATAQFFINVVDNGFLDHTAPNGRGWGYCVFGKVTRGMEVAEAIVSVPTGPGGPFPGDAPQKMVIIEDIQIVSAK
ncbi:MAG: peptidylprolyl isomerase [Betaproteobacteria bacterium]|jgi:peptidyl-prolyl cis-trans isomerase A (cyclophilin A)/peptidyl-prolyl cis-trans isomerase B (cyclophilin B)